MHATTLTNPETGLDYAVSFVTVTPEMSAEFEDSGMVKGNFRSFKEAGAARYAQDVRDGNWFFTGDTVKINVEEDGSRRICDGQHRVMLPGLSGLPVTFLFIEGRFDDEAEDIMDTGMVRSLKDVLHANKEGSLGYCGQLASLISAAMRYRPDGPKGVTATFGTRPSRSQQLAFLRDNPQLHDGVSVCERVRVHTDIIPLPVRAAWYMLNKVDEEDCEVFFERLAEPAAKFIPEGEGDPIHQLRIKATREKKRPGGSNDQTYWTRLIVKTWNNFRAGNDVTALSLKATEKVFPV